MPSAQLEEDVDSGGVWSREADFLSWQHSAFPPSELPLGMLGEALVHCFRPSDGSEGEERGSLSQSKRLASKWENHPIKTNPLNSHKGADTTQTRVSNVAADWHAGCCSGRRDTQFQNTHGGEGRAQW